MDEFKALARCMKELANLDANEASRVALYLHDKFNIKSVHIPKGVHVPKDASLANAGLPLGDGKVSM
jgi:hypothetical protein